MLVTAGAQSAISASFIRCKNKTGEEVTITLNAMRKFSAILNCIKADLISDMTPCAPNGGFGLSAPTGDASLTGIVRRWQDYGDHMGGVAGNRIDSSTIWFEGGYMSPGDQFHLGWTFTVDRLSGTAVLKTFDDDIMGTKAGSVTYTCSPVDRKF